LVFSDQKPILVYTGPRGGADAVQDVVAEWFEVRCVAPEVSVVAHELKTASAFLDASMKVRITRPMIEASSSLRLVVTATTGADHIDEQALMERGILLFTLRGQSEVLKRLTPAAEHSWLLLMACARRLVAAQAHVLAGGWDRAGFPGVMLRGKTVGLIGCGRIGQWMARYAEAFGMSVQGYDPLLTEWPSSIRRADLMDLLASSDFISLHVTLTPETRRLLGRAHFEHMKPGAIFINTSRGELIDEQALLESLQCGRLLAAGLDVLSGEPDIQDHPLRRYALEHDHLIITPHIGGYSPEAVREVVRFSAERVLQYFGFRDARTNP